MWLDVDRENTVHSTREILRYFAAAGLPRGRLHTDCNEDEVCVIVACPMATSAKAFYMRPGNGRKLIIQAAPSAPCPNKFSYRNY